MSLRAVLCVVLFAGSLSAWADSIDDLGWMTGHWVSGENGELEEIWLEPRSGSLPGTMRWVMEGDRHVLEYLVIQQAEDGVVFRFKHYNVDYTAWEKDEPNTYRLVQSGPTMARFERTSDNPRVPSVMVYERKGDVMTFSAHGDPAETEPGMRLEFRLRK
ncbi:MAG: DUF6265 family protein [Pseudomonadales bacterium]